MNCILCGSPKTFEWYQDKLQTYFLCHGCTFVFVPRNQMLSAFEEKKRYDTHENNDDDPRYREYLTKIRNSVTPFLTKESLGLDFGCGASHLLARIFSEENFVVDSYDLYYHPEEKIWDKTYDFIVLSEVIEHLSWPVATMEKLAKLLKPGGQIFIKTMFLPEKENAFAGWFYKNDPTHVQFFNFKSMEKLAQILNMQGPIKLPSPDLYRLWS